MNEKNSLKGSNFHDGVDVNLFPKDPLDIHPEPSISFDLGLSNKSSEKTERSDSIRLLKESLHAIAESESEKKENPAKLSTGITSSGSHHNLLGLDFQIDIPKKTLTVPKHTFNRHSVSLPVTPQTSPKLERKTGGLLRKASGTSLRQMGIVPEHSLSYSGGPMDKRDNSSIARKGSQIKGAITKDVVDSASISAKSGSQSAASASWLVNSGFGNWLNKKTNLDNKEMNAMAPSF